MNDVNFRLLQATDADYKLLEKWYQEKEIYTSLL